MCITPLSTAWTAILTYRWAHSLPIAVASEALYVMKSTQSYLLLSCATTHCKAKQLLSRCSSQIS